MTAPLSTKHRNSANITSTQLAAMLKVKSSDIGLLIAYGLPSIPDGKVKRFNVGRVHQWCMDHQQVLHAMQADYKVAHEIRLTAHRAYDKAKRAAKKETKET